MAPLDIAYGSSLIWDEPEENSTPPLGGAPSNVPDAMAAQKVGSVAMLPYRSLQPMAAISSLPVVIEQGSYKMQRRANLVADGLQFPRPSAQLGQRVSVYGVAPQVQADTVAHHPAGWNRELVLADGQPDVQAIERAIAKVAIPVDLKVRLNFVESAWFSQAAYDNPVPLLVNFLRLYYKQLFLETASRSEYLATVDYEDAQAWVEGYTTVDASGAVRWTDLSAACNAWAQLIKVGMTPAAFIFYWGNARQTRDALTSLAPGTAYVTRLTVFEAPRYDDGHAQIHSGRYARIGFVEGRFLYLPMTWATTWPHCRPPRADLFVAKHGVEVERLGGSRTPNEYAYVHGAGLSDEELVTLVWAYLPSPTTTPFMVDMDVPMPTEVSMLRVNRPEKPSFTEPSQVDDLFGRHRPTAAGIFHTCMKVVYVNRWEEAFFEALRYITPFIAQPEPDTIESHLWLAYAPQLDLPRLGLYRGVHAMYVSGTALVLSHNPKQVRSCAAATANALLVYGPITRAMLQWGEYLYFTGSQRGLSTLVNLDGQTADDDIEVQYRAPAMISGLTGVEEASFPWAGTGISCSRRLCALMFGPQTVQLDQLDAPLRAQLEEAQAIVVSHAQATHVTYRRAVAPAGLPFVVGSGGVLTQGTPLAPSFRIRVGALRRHRRSQGYQMDWDELWMWTVAHRWYGYDVLYQAPNTVPTGPDLVGWAANWVSICPPPPVVDTDAEGALFRVDAQPVQRKFSWSLPTEGLANGEGRVFTWRLEGLWCTRGLEHMAPVSRYVMGGAVTTICYDPSYADLFLGLARVHVTLDPHVPQVFRVVPSPTTRLAAGQIPSSLAEPSSVSKDPPPGPEDGTLAPAAQE